MKNLKFVWLGKGELSKHLNRGYKTFAIETASHGKPIAITFFGKSGGGLRIQSRMHDIGERLEIGVLEFGLSAAVGDSQNQIELPVQFQESTTADKLIIEQDGLLAESGILLRGELGAEIVIVAGTYPYTLAVSAPGFNGSFDPEYSMERYRRSPLE